MKKTIGFLDFAAEHYNLNTFHAVLNDDATLSLVPIFRTFRLVQWEAAASAVVPTLAHSAPGAHARLCLRVSVSSACQRHLVQNVLVRRPLSRRNTQICSWRHTHKGAEQLQLPEGELRRLCRGHSTAFLSPCRLIGDDKGCSLSVALVPCGTVRLADERVAVAVYAAKG